MRNAIAGIALFAGVLSGCGPAEVPADAEVGTNEQALTGYTWHHEIYRESCLDMFGTYCSATVPRDQCGNITNGSPCSISGDFCWKVISKGYVEGYSCH